MDTTLTFIINNALADQLLSDPKELKTLESHCEGVTAKLSLHEFKISDNAGRVVYTSNNA